MTLYTFYKTDEKVVYGTSVNGKAYFFYKGFNSAEEAKKIIIDSADGFHKVWIETTLIGNWSEIQ